MDPPILRLEDLDSDSEVELARRRAHVQAPESGVIQADCPQWRTDVASGRFSCRERERALHARQSLARIRYARKRDNKAVVTAISDK